MADPFVIRIPHKLGKAEARRRMREAFEWFKENHGAAIRLSDEIWTDDDVNFRGGGLGYSVPGLMTFADAEVVLSMQLPWLVKKLIAPFQDALIEKARALLQDE